MTSCGSTSERKAAVIHGVVAGLYLALLTLDAVMAVWHLASVRSHRRRAGVRLPGLARMYHDTMRELSGANPILLGSRPSDDEPT